MCFCLQFTCTSYLCSSLPVNLSKHYNDGQYGTVQCINYSLRFFLQMTSMVQWMVLPPWWMDRSRVRHLLLLHHHWCEPLRHLSMYDQDKFQIGGIGPEKYHILLIRRHLVYSLVHESQQGFLSHVGGETNLEVRIFFFVRHFFRFCPFFLQKYYRFNEIFFTLFGMKKI